MKLRLFSLLLLAGCVKGVLPGSEAFEYTDSESFRASIPMRRTDVEKSSVAGEKTYLFRETRDGLHIRFRIREAKTKDDLFDPKYEPGFLGSCVCAVVRRGVVHAGDLAAREYVVTTDQAARTGYYRHIGTPKNVVAVEVSGPADQEARVQQIFQTLTQNLVILKQD